MGGKRVRINITDGRLARMAKRLHREKALGHEPPKGETWLEKMKDWCIYTIRYPNGNGGYSTYFFPHKDSNLRMEFAIRYIKNKIETAASGNKYCGVGLFTCPGPFTFKGTKTNGQYFRKEILFALQRLPSGHRICTIKKEG